MKKLTTILCSIAFMIGGIMIATSYGSLSLPGSIDAYASPVFNYSQSGQQSQPLGFSLSQASNDIVRDTITVVRNVHDTVWVPKVKYVKVPTTKYIQKHDTLYVSVTANNSGADREEDTAVGFVSTKNENHSTTMHSSARHYCDCLRDSGLVR